MSKYKTPVLRSVVIICILALSVVSGAVFGSLFHRAELKKYPRDFSDLVTKYAEEYGVPEYLVYGVIKYESSFASNAVGEDGGVGLMGVRPSEFESLLKLTKEDLTGDALYGPETNIKYGTYQLSHLYNSFESWDAVVAAKIAGESAASEWLADSENFNDAGVFETVPDEAAGEAAEECMEAVQKYRELYYSDDGSK